MTYLCRREYEHIRRGDISDAAFEWLESLANQRKRGEKEFLRHHGKSLQVRNFVGILETPDGTCLEILPKTADTASPEADRALLWKMLHVVHNLPFQEMSSASLEKRQGALLEILIARFLQEISQIVHRGIRSDYVRVTAEAAFLKGRLRVAQQIRQPVSRLHRFQIEYDCFLPERAENRLIKAALQYVTKSSRHLDNQRLARELLFAFDAIPASTQIKSDFSRWSSQRDMVYYRAAKPWVELILLRETPWFLKGKWQGISLLFPMEKLFEAYVAACLRKKLDIKYQLVEQSRKHHLIENHNDKPLFQLKPDMCIREGGCTRLILDAKWKRLDINADRYDLSQSDFYQLFAYGHKYLSSVGNLLLIYPKTNTFFETLPSFHFDEKLTLWVVPFCLEHDQLLLPEGILQGSLLKS